METTYRLIVIGESGMYTYGDEAATPELARLVPGPLKRDGRRLGIEQLTRDPANPLLAPSRLLMDAERHAGDWFIGAGGITSDGSAVMADGDWWSAVNDLAPPIIPEVENHRRDVIKGRLGRDRAALRAQLAEYERAYMQTVRERGEARQETLRVAGELDTVRATLAAVLAAPASLRKIGMSGTEGDTIEDRVRAWKPALAAKAKQQSTS